jgi:uncharacterized protein YbjQ (UPF0145 family)
VGGALKGWAMSADPGANAIGSRLERLRGGGPFRSLLSAQEFSALAGVGFDPVGEVLGTSAVHLGFVSRGGKCSTASYSSAKTDLASASTGPFSALLRKRSGIRRLVVARAVEECKAMGGDGIVGLKLTIRPFPSGGTEFRLQGTAVRARGAIHLATPFTTHMSGQELASLLRAGWMPGALVFGMSMGARHDDQRTTTQTRRTAGNREVSSYTRLVNDTRRDARVQLEKALTAHGGDGVVVDEITLHVGERECPSAEGAHDHICEVVIMGTSIVSLGQPAQDSSRAPLAVMHLSPRGSAAHEPSTVSFLESGASDQPPAPDEPEGGHLDRFLAARAAKRASGPLSSVDSAFRPSRDDRDE